MYPNFFYKLSELTLKILRVLGKMCRSDSSSQERFLVLRKIHERHFLHNVMNLTVALLHQDDK